MKKTLDHKKNTNRKTSGSRKIYLDIIRILAIYLVLFTHTGRIGSKLYKIYVDTPQGFFYIMLDCLRTVNNPLLFMVSGALLLGKEETIGMIWKKRISRFLIVLLSASFLQVLIISWQDGSLASFSIYETFKSILESPVRRSYWYLYAYVGFLLMLPFLRLTAAKIKLQEGIYLMILGIVMGPVFEVLSAFMGISKINISPAVLTLNVFYPLVAYVIESRWDEIRKGMGKYGLMILGLMSFAGLVISAYATYNEFKTEGAWSENWIGLANPVLPVFLFILIRECVEKSGVGERPRFTSLLRIVSGSVFGIYLMENLLKAVTRPVFDALNTFMPTIVSCLIWLITVIAVGTLLVNVLKKIPLIKNYL